MQYNIARYVVAALAQDQERIALIDDGVEITRRQLLDAVRDHAKILMDQVQPDEFVIVLCGRGSAFWVELLALWIVGAKPVCLEPDVEAAHGANVLGLTNATRICKSDVEMPDCFSSLAPLPATSLREDGPIDDPQEGVLLPGDFPFVAAEHQPAAAALIFTSGTTGLPKGVPLSHEQLVMNALATSTRLRLRESDRLLIATPFRFISSISHFLVTMMAGATFAGVEAKLMIKDLLEIMADSRITAFGGSPFHLHFLAMAGAERLPDLRWAMSSGDHLSVNTIDALDTSFPELELHTVYGMSELAGRMCTLRPEYLARKKGSVGLPIPGIEVDVRDEDLRFCEPLAIGDVYIRSTFGFTGYLSNPEANAAALSSHGFKTGDKGYRDEDGFLFLAGRSDSVFKRSGLKVSAKIITEALQAVESIVDGFADSEENAVEGRVPVAYVAVAEGGFERLEVLRALREVLPTNHLPSKFVEVPEIPRTGSGKVDRRRLQALVEEATK